MTDDNNENNPPPSLKMSKSQKRSISEGHVVTRMNRAAPRPQQGGSSDKTTPSKPKGKK